MTSHGEAVFSPNSNGRTTHPFWGDFREWWPGSVQEEKKTGCGVCKGAVSDPGPPSVDVWYDTARAGPSDFHEHMDTLRDLASKCESVTEIGYWHKPALLALAVGCPGKVTSIAPNGKPDWRHFEKFFGDRFRGVPADQPESIEPTDLLFVDTHHRADRVYQELSRYHAAVGKYIVVHCTTDPFGETGDDGGPGVMVGVRRFLKEHTHWTAIRHDKNNHGMIVLSRLESDRKQLPGTLRKALNFSKALARHAADGMKVVPDSVWEERMDHCLTCEHRNLDSCSACGCPVQSKASWASEECGLVKLGLPPKWTKHEETAP